MPLAGTLTGSVRAQSDALLMARILGANGALLNQISLTSISYLVTDTSTGNPVAQSTLSIAATVFNNLQQSDPRWTMDSQANPGTDGLWGYNFSFTLPASALPNSVRYQVDVMFLTVTGGQFIVSWSFVPQKVYL